MGILLDLCSKSYARKCITISKRQKNSFHYQTSSAFLTQAVDSWQNYSIFCLTSHFSLLESGMPSEKYKVPRL